MHTKMAGFLPPVLGCAVFLAITCSMFKVMNNAQPEPYMDEIFHVPQAQQYCRGNFSSWDPMITTLPGLYLASVVGLSPVAWLQGVPLSEICTTQALRAVNIAFMIGNFWLLYFLAKHLQKCSPGMATLQALTLSMFPVLHFFSSLYYTDPGAVFFSLLLYLLCLQDRHFLSALAGSMAIIFRQTNIVWVVFAAGLVKRNVIIRWMESEKKKEGERLDSVTLNTVFKLIVRALKRRPRDLMKWQLKIVKATWWYLCVLAAFVGFIVINEGIVVGDRSHHQACLNFPQLFYFFSVAFVFAWMHLLSLQRVVNFFKACWQNHLIALTAVGCSILLINYFTHVHKYLLADNRHYTFYVWSKIYRRHELVKYILIPGYLFAMWSSLISLKGRDVLWKISFGICLLVATVPQKLMEFRYFILPFYILHLNMRINSKLAIIVQLMMFVAIDVASVYMYVKRPFFWPNDKHNLQRFMW